MTAQPPTTPPAPNTHWVEFMHPGDVPCPDPESLRYPAHAWVEVPDDTSNPDLWQGVQCGGCATLLTEVSDDSDDDDGGEPTPLPHPEPDPEPGAETKPAPDTEEGTS